MHTYIYTYIYTYIKLWDDCLRYVGSIYIHTYIHTTYIYIYTTKIITYENTCIHTYIHTYIHTVLGMTVEGTSSPYVHGNVVFASQHPDSVAVRWIFARIYVCMYVLVCSRNVVFVSQQSDAVAVRSIFAYMYYVRTFVSWWCCVQCR